jgi:hypothetical protein
MKILITAAPIHLPGDQIGPPHPPGPHHPHPPDHHHEHRPPPEPIVEALRMLVRHKRFTDVADVAACAHAMGEEAAASILEEIDQAFASPPVDDALAALETRLRLDAHLRTQRFLQAAAGKPVGLIFPLPPHIHHTWISHAKVSIMIPSGHPLPPHLQATGLPLVTGTRECRAAVGGFDTIVVEGFRNNDHLVGNVEAVDVLDRNRIPSTSAVYVHLRPHPHHDDVQFDFEPTRLTVL